MARIVSGEPEYQDAGLAFLAGYEGSRKRRQEEQQAQQALQLRQMQLMLQMQDASVRHAYQKAKTQELLNEQAASGDMAALRELALRQKMNPDEQLAEDVLGNLKSLPEKYQKEAAGIYGQMIEEQRAQKAYAGAGKEIERATEDGLIDENAALTYKQRLQAKQQSGESPDDILTEFSTARQKRATDAANTEENTHAFEEARTMLQSAPPGRNRKIAEIAVKEYEMSPSLQREEGSGAKMLAAVQKALVGSVAEHEKAKKARLFIENLKPMVPGEEGDEARMKELEASFADYPRVAGRMQTQKTSRYPEGTQGNGAASEADADGMDEQAVAQGIADVYRESRGSIQEVRKFVQSQGLDESDPNVQLWIRNVMEAMTSADRQ